MRKLGLFAVNRAESTQDEDEGLDEAYEPLANPDQSLDDYVAETYPGDDVEGWTIVLRNTDVMKNRKFVVVDGNHRLAALQALANDDPVKCDWDVKGLHVRVAVLQQAALPKLLDMGFLVNKIRGIQAQDQFYDRIQQMVFQVR